MSAGNSAALRFPLSERLEWRGWVTPKPLKDKPIHRWFTFPHSYTDDLVHALIDEWGLTSADHILDPFAGAGTTLLAAKHRGISATGFDLSPLAVLASRVKVADLDVNRLAELREHLDDEIFREPDVPLSRDYPELVKKALPGKALRSFNSILTAITRVIDQEIERDFFRLALLSILPVFSRAVATGGWLKWVDKNIQPERVPRIFSEQTAMMLSDLPDVHRKESGYWEVRCADARRLSVNNAFFTAVITSPPYPNRHDYTRVFGVELMLALLDWEETRRLRYQSFQSHPEARPERASPDGYVESQVLIQALGQLQRKGLDGRVLRMLRGYFVDTYLCLKEIRGAVHEDGKIALVLGNVQYLGVTIPVDELVADAGEQAGLSCTQIMAVRYRGNSAQQMGRFGRNPSRESIVLFCNGE